MQATYQSHWHTNSKVTSIIYLNNPVVTHTRNGFIFKVLLEKINFRSNEAHKTQTK